MRVLLSIVFLAALILGGCSASSGAPASKSDADTRTTTDQAAAPVPPSGGSGAAAPKPAATAAAAAPAAQAAQARAAAEAGRAAEAARPAAPGGYHRRSRLQSRGAVAQQPVPPRPGAPGAAAGPNARPSQRPAAVQAAQIGRMVIYVTDLALLVINPTQTADAIGDVATQAGGYIAGVENKDDNGTPLTIVRLKVPPERYDPTMRQLRGLAVEVTSEKATTQDVTEEFNDVQTQLAALDASYKQLLDLMSKAQNVDEVLKIQSKLAETKTQIDRLKGRQTFLQRSSELATITVNLRPASDVLAQTYSTQKSQLRRAESQRAQLTLALQRARTPEEEATLRDQLGDVALQIDRFNARITQIESEAATAKITLPAPPADDPSTSTATTSQDVVADYLRLRGDLRAAEADRDRLTKVQRQNPTPEASEQLRQAIVKVTTLGQQVSAAEERAKRTGTVLPTLTPDQVAALAGLPPEAWSPSPELAMWSLGMVALVIVALAAITIRRRRGRGPTPPPAAPPIAPTPGAAASSPAACGPPSRRASQRPPPTRTGISYRVGAWRCHAPRPYAVAATASLRAPRSAASRRPRAGASQARIRALGGRPGASAPAWCTG